MLVSSISPKYATISIQSTTGRKNRGDWIALRSGGYSGGDFFLRWASLGADAANREGNDDTASRGRLGKQDVENVVVITG